MVNKRVMGIEPTLRAWEAPVLPLNYTRNLSDPSEDYANNQLQRHCEKPAEF